MPEMILPGTYIEVRDEGLIVPGPISISNLGIVGTAARGRLANANDPTTIYTPSNLGEAREIFGQYDALNNPTLTGNELTLVRALELAYASGANRVFAARVAGASAVDAVFTIAGGVTLTSVAPGSGYNDYDVSISAAVAAEVDVTITRNGLVVEGWRSVPEASDDFAAVINGTHATYNYDLNSSTGGASRLFSAGSAGGTVISPQDVAGPSTPGADGADANQANYETGLAALENQNVHIIVTAGRDFSASLAAHVENASTDLNKRERIGVVGPQVTGAAAAQVTNFDNPPDQQQGRLVVVGPGVRAFDAVAGREVTLSASYAAAAVAGRIASLDPHFSPTNKTLNVLGLQTVFNGTQLEQLVLDNVLALEDRDGSIRIVRGVTSSTNTAWTQITTRRIVDYARFGVRAAANPFIGKLNNERVRQALKGSINTILADMVDREMLISYELEVSATRAQQIRGIAQVDMVVRPTFSIDYIRVVMYLE